MLDEAIEYLKSLQLQVQVWQNDDAMTQDLYTSNVIFCILWSMKQMMWMGGRMAQMILPGAQQSMPGMAVGVGHACVPLMHHALQSSTPNQTLSSTSPAFQAAMFRNLMQSAHLQESHASSYLGLHHVQPRFQACSFIFTPLDLCLFAEIASTWPNAGDESIHLWVSNVAAESPNSLWEHPQKWIW